MPDRDSWATALADLTRRIAGRASQAAGSSDRRVYLSRVLAIQPEEIDDSSDGAARLIVQRLAAALRSERARGRAGHWTYDLNRHIALIQAYKAERRRLVQLTGAQQSIERKSP